MDAVGFRGTGKRLDKAVAIIHRDGDRGLI